MTSTATYRMTPWTTGTSSIPSFTTSTMKRMISIMYHEFSTVDGKGSGILEAVQFDTIGFIQCPEASSKSRRRNSMMLHVQRLHETHSKYHRDKNPNNKPNHFCSSHHVRV